MPPPSPKAKMLESLRIPDGEGMPSPYNTTIRYSAKQSFTIQRQAFGESPRTMEKSTPDGRRAFEDYPLRTSMNSFSISRVISSGRWA